jgi:methionine biosynthesis protein MetW
MISSSVSEIGGKLRGDLGLIADIVEPGTRVLDIGCGDGRLLEFLTKRKAVIGRGLELSQKGVNASVGRGLSVVQGDADRDLIDYPDAAFDYAILGKTLQTTHDPRAVLLQLVRIGRQAIVSFPNFGHWKVRLSLLLNGRMPMTSALPEAWYATANLHPCTLRDFLRLCQDCGIEIVQAFTICEGHRARPLRQLWRANLMGEDGIVLLRKKALPSSPG